MEAVGKSCVEVPWGRKVGSEVRGEGSVLRKEDTARRYKPNFISSMDIQKAYQKRLEGNVTLLTSHCSLPDKKVPSTTNVACCTKLPGKLKCVCQNVIPVWQKQKNVSIAILLVFEAR